ncbi:hypothetical protein ACET3Z_017934 [Daucus carota]
MSLSSLQDDLYRSSGQSLDGSFRKSRSGLSSYKSSSISASGNFAPASKGVFKSLRDYAKKLNDLDLFIQILEDWVVENSHADSTNGEMSFRSPFSINDLRTIDYALEGFLFQQLFRMPCSPYDSDNMREDQYLALEDFLHTIADGLWRTFWHKSGSLPYYISCPRHPGSKFYTVEKAILRRRLGALSGAALVSKVGSNERVHWDKVVEFALFKEDILMKNDLGYSPSVISEALFYGVHILLSRSLNKYNTNNSDSVFILVLDSKFGGVVKLGGDLAKLELNPVNPYQSIVEWIQCHAQIDISPVDRVWNKLGNANWRDLGTLQLILATFYSIAQCHGPPRKSITSLASQHSLRLQKRRIECKLYEDENGLLPLEQVNHENKEIIELDHSDHPFHEMKASRLKPQQGEILLLEDQDQGQRCYQICESFVGGTSCTYSAVALDCPIEMLTLYIGAHPSRLEQSLEDMSMWYLVQRQSKVLNIFKDNGISSRYLPEILAYGRILHSGPCKKESPKGLCDHPWCGTSILVTYPFGESLSSTASLDGPLSSEEAVRCCRDCLSALRSAKMANIQHGNICPENIIRVAETEAERESFLYVLVSWGRAVLEERDSPAINLQFSSAHALQNGKLCPSSDAESLVYLLYFVCGGKLQQQDSIESALQWRQKCWAKRYIQQRLGEVSSLLKAFADYIDSLCGTPYPVDYDIWIKRLSKAVDSSADRGKKVEEMLRLTDIAESSGTSKGENSFVEQEQE